MLHDNVMKKFRLEVIQLCATFLVFFIVGIVEASRVVGWCRMSNGGRHVAWIILFLVLWIHAAIYFSYYPHVDIVREDNLLMSCPVNFI